MASLEVRCSFPGWFLRFLFISAFLWCSDHVCEHGFLILLGFTELFLNLWLDVFGQFWKIPLR